LGNLSEQTQDSKDRILNAAEELFSNQGYDGTSVSGIAEKAGVNKALIYYYFKSKEDILQCLFTTLLDDITNVLIRDVMKEVGVMEEGSFFNEQFLKAMTSKYLEFFIERRNIMRVMVTESLKNGANAFLLFKFTDVLNSEQAKAIFSSLEKRGIKVNLNKNSLSVGKFFMGFIPMINFAIYYDQWKYYYNMTDEEYKSTFINMYQMAYEGYKQEILKK
jgi:AcrR family transcriptional regulator